MKRPLHNTIDGVRRSTTRVTGSLSVICLGLALFCAGATFQIFGEPAPPTEYPEYQLKAGYLWNFSRYVDWPARSFKQTNSPLVIGILGQDRFGNDLRKLVAGKKVEGHDLVVRKVETMDQSRECQILFISMSERKRTIDILQALKSAPVLTVGESEGFIQAGGIINFQVRDRELLLDINRTAAEKVGLRISSKLLKISDKSRESK
jgi:hypothetical protein